MRKTLKKWTTDEDEVVLRYVRAHPQNLHKCFVLISEHLIDSGNPRTPSAIQAHWYNVLSKKPEALCFFAHSVKHIPKNRKTKKETKEGNSIWQRLIKFIRNLWFMKKI